MSSAPISMVSKRVSGGGVSPGCRGSSLSVDIRVQMGEPECCTLLLHAGGRDYNITGLCTTLNLRFELEGDSWLSPFVKTAEKSWGDRAASDGDGL